MISLSLTEREEVESKNDTQRPKRLSRVTARQRSTLARRWLVAHRANQTAARDIVDVTAVFTTQTVQVFVYYRNWKRSDEL